MRETVTTRPDPSLNLVFMKKRLFIALIVLALLILAGLGVVIGTGGD